jgi:hypothetical protein
VRLCERSPSHIEPVCGTPKRKSELEWSITFAPGCDFSYVDTPLATVRKDWNLPSLAESPPDFVAKDGVRIETWPDEIMATFRFAWESLAKEKGDLDAYFNEVQRAKAQSPSEARVTTPAP